MCLLAQHLLHLDLSNDDALVIQTNNIDEMGVPNYSEADAMICRVETDSGESWYYHTLVCLNEKLIVMSQISGTLQDVVRAARFQFGKKLDDAELLGVSYKSADFPRYLFSYLN